MSHLKPFIALLTFTALLIFPVAANAAPPEQVPPEHAGQPEREAPPGEAPPAGSERGNEQGQERAAANRDRVLIVRACHAERGNTAATVAAFRAEYGTNPNGANAFGRCVSTRMKEGAPQNGTELRALVQEIRERKLAARACAAELRELGRAEFAQTYGTNRNLFNAFGKCVSNKAEGPAED